MFAEAWGLSGAARGKFSQPVVLSALQGNGPCGKEASLLKHFCFFWCSKEVAPAAMSGRCYHLIINRLREEVKLFLPETVYFLRILLTCTHKPIFAQ
jgi:hypothetical protein